MSRLRIEPLSLDEWGAALPASGTEVFHTLAMLATIDGHFDSEVHLFGVFEDQEPVALFPTFVRRNPLGRVAVSSPPSMAIPCIGSVMMSNSPKQNAYESVNREFADLMVEELGICSNRTSVRLLCSPAYLNPRPFEWTGFAVKPSLTYRLDLGGRSLDEIQVQSSNSLRHETRQTRELDITITDEGLDGTCIVYDDVVSRYDKQDEPFRVPWEFIESLVGNPGDRCRVYVTRDPGDEYLSGIIVTFSGKVGYFWLGDTRGEYDGISINSLLHRTVIEDIARDETLTSATKYDLVSMNTERLYSYKSKFDDELVPYYVIELTSIGMNLTKRIYQLLYRRSERIATK